MVMEQMDPKVSIMFMLESCSAAALAKQPVLLARLSVFIYKAC